jgi:ATP-dependent 26S proteasome regulatory subunit
MDFPLASQLARIDARIEREIHRLRARYQLSLDEFRGLYVSDEQVDQALTAARPQSPPDPAVPAERLAAGAQEADPRWRHLVRAFDLAALDEDLLLIAAAPEFDLKYETLYAYLNNDITRKWPTCDLAQRLLADVAGVGAVVGALAPGGTLHRHRLIQRVDPPTGRPALLNTGYALHPYVAHWLYGHTPAMAFMADGVVWSSGWDLPPYDDAARTRAQPMVRLWNGRQARGGPLPVVALVGQPGSGRAATAAAVAAATGRSFARVNLRAIAGRGDAAGEVLDRLCLALALEPPVVLLEGLDALVDDEQHRSGDRVRLGLAIAAWPASVLVLLRADEGEQWRTFAPTRRVIEVRCDIVGYADRVALWRDAARSEAVDIPEAELQNLVGRFSLTRGQVHATFATALDLATMSREGGDATPGQVAAAARLTSDQALGRFATKVDRKHDWPELVLPPPTVRRLHELAAAIRHRHLVYDEWGFGGRLITGTGIKALFAGASGTGKTMAAGVIARELDLDLYKIDLSGIVSKYIGETEKNLDRIFRAARAANAIVFLDEAEAIMGKRSEVKDAHDRYANIEVAYLLQKLEEHDGIVILATNLRRNIDDAFDRRMQYVIDFPRPDEAQRHRIWRGMFPPQAPLGTDLDFGFLARQFDLAGGDIRNVVLDAAFLAARDGGVIGMRAVVEALARQLAKQGKTPTGSDFRQYQGLLSRSRAGQDGR